MHSATPHSLFALLLTISTLPYTYSQQVTLANGDDYKNGRPCMTNCLYYLAGNNGCANIDQCVCRLDLQPQITSYISSCVSNGCSNTVDIQSGVSIYQAYCAGKASSLSPIVTPVATQQVVQTTIIDRQTVGITATVTDTTLVTTTVQDISTITRFTGTVTTKVPSSLTEIIYSTFTTIVSDSNALQQTFDAWGLGQKGLTTQGKIAIAVGVVAGVFLVAFLVTLCCCLSRRNERSRRTQVGGNQGWDNHNNAYI
ncbi:hypothetical protein TWF694_011368 [Orbilia ellipsospora]|uniref:Extracellular membrane protein CFEM domain-containing protein n=1 Tax=Orbilia ellipsospora TaxID=2528407 RepID=A0AAV9X6E7_9PEZI